MVDFLFVILSILAIGGAIALITITNPFKATLGMLICVTSIAGLFALLSSTFLFMVQLIVYSGAILTLTLFVIMFLNLDETSFEKNGLKRASFMFFRFFDECADPISLLALLAIGFNSLRNLWHFVIGNNQSRNLLSSRW